MCLPKCWSQAVISVYVCACAILVCAGKSLQDRLEAALTFYSVHVGVAAMAVCSIAQRRLDERAAYLHHRTEAV